MNFLKGLASVDDTYEYYSYCDQDDIWHKDKLLRGIKIMESQESDLAFLYGTKTWIANKDCTKILGESISVKRPLTFQNAIFNKIVVRSYNIRGCSAKAFRCYYYIIKFNIKSCISICKNI